MKKRSRVYIGPALHSTTLAVLVHYKSWSEYASLQANPNLCLKKVFKSNFFTGPSFNPYHFAASGSVIMSESESNRMQPTSDRDPQRNTGGQEAAHHHSIVSLNTATFWSEPV